MFKVVDDFYSNPQEFIDEAKTLSYDQEGIYPGLSAKGDLNLPDEFLNKIRGYLGSPEIWWSEPGLFRAAYQDAKPTNFTHADNYVTGPRIIPSYVPHFAAVLYLSDGGQLDFHMSKETRSNSLDCEADRESYMKNREDPSKWIKYLSIPVKKNRLVLFNASLYHNPAPPYGYGTTIEDCRLIRVFWFYVGSPPLNFDETLYLNEIERGHNP